jgi:hypothetical protein
VELLHPATGEVRQTFYLESEETKKIWLTGSGLIESGVSKEKIQICLFIFQEGLKRQTHSFLLRAAKHPAAITVNQQRTFAALIKHSGEMILLQLGESPRKHLFFRDENPDPLTSVCFSGSGTSVFLCREGGTVEWRETHSLVLLKTLICEQAAPILQVVCSDDDQWLGTWQEGGIVSLHNLHTPQRVPGFAIYPEKEIRGIRFHPFRNRLMIQGTEEIGFLDPTTRAIAGHMHTGKMIAAAVVGRQDGTLVLASATGEWRSVELPPELLHGTATIPG